MRRPPIGLRAEVVVTARFSAMASYTPSTDAGDGIWNQ